MNINPESDRFTEVVAWDSLTPEQQQSGDWILLPDVSNEPRRARRMGELEKAFAKVRPDA